MKKNLLTSEIIVVKNKCVTWFTKKYDTRFQIELLILPTNVFSAKPGTINFEWKIAASSDNFSSVPCESDEELEYLPITIPLTKL